MSNNTERWEEALAQSIKEHEFDFDPAAWVEMGGMMDAAGVAINKGSGGEAAPPEPEVITTAGKTITSVLGFKTIIASVLLVFGVVLLALYLSSEPERLNNSATVPASSVSPIKSQGLSTTEQAGLPNEMGQYNQEIGPIQKTIIGDHFRSPAPDQRIVTSEKVSDVSEAKWEEPVIEQRRTSLIMSLPQRSLVKVTSIDTATLLTKKKFKINSTVSPDRPTLFPNVEDKY